ncbi:MAG: SIMPL domain-containing protein [Microscillaceae bacterium]|nr:SIMPL domain-containing protein [Microscillaceae bacterium]
MQKLAIFLLLSFIHSNLLSQNPDNQILKNVINVTGTAEMEVVPNEIFVGIILRERMVNREKLSIESQEEKMKTELKNAGFDLKNLSLADAGANFSRLRGGKKDVIASKRYTLKVATVEELNKAFDIFDKLDIQEADVLRVHHTEMEKYRKEIKIKAIQAAKVKAEYLLEAIGEKLGKPLEIVELDDYNDISPVFRNQTANVNYYQDAVAASEAINFQKIKIRYSVKAKFEIKP